MKTTPSIFPLACTISVVLVACASKPGVVFDQSSGEHVWPPPPDAPRVRYVGQIRSANDLKPSRSTGERVAEFLFGKEETPGMVSPLGVCTDNADRVFIADSNAQVVHVFNLSTRRYEQWAPKKPQPAFVQPVAVAFDAGTGRLLASDPAGGLIYVFDTGGTCTGTIGVDSLQRPCGLAVHPTTGMVAVADVDAHQIVMLGRDGTETARLGSRGTGPGQFNFPTYVAFDSAGRLYVSDSLNFRVQVFGADLGFVRSIGRKGDMPGYFSQPKGLALDPEDHLYVVDANFEAVQVFSTEGALLMTFGREGDGPGQFWLPAGLATDGTGRIWVADSYNRRVQVFQYVGVAPTGTALGLENDSGGVP